MKKLSFTGKEDYRSYEEDQKPQSLYLCLLNTPTKCQDHRVPLGLKGDDIKRLFCCFMFY